MSLDQSGIASLWKTEHRCGPLRLVGVGVHCGLVVGTLGCHPNHHSWCLFSGGSWESLTISVSTIAI